MTFSRFVALALCALWSLPALGCSVSVTGLNFGSIDPLASTAHDSNGTITVTCPSATSFTVSLSPGTGTFAQRTMVSGGHALRYNIFLDSAMTMVWGDGTSGTSTWSGTADSAGTNHTIYGEVPYQPKTYAGTYSDTITVTVSY